MKLESAALACPIEIAIAVFKEVQVHVGELELSVHTFAAKKTELKQRKRKYEEAARALDKRERKIARNEIKAAALIEEGNTYLVEKTNEGDKLIKAKRAKAATILAAANLKAANVENVANDYFMEKTAEADEKRAATFARAAEAELYMKAWTLKSQEEVNAEGARYLLELKNERSWLDDVDVSLLEN